MVRRGVEQLGVKKFIEKTRWKGLSQRYEDIKRHFDTPEKALTNSLLTTAYQSTQNSSDQTLQSARELATSLGAVFYNWSVESQVQDYRHTLEQAIGHTFSWQDDDITLQNIQARARSPIIWMLTNFKGSLLLTTSNRSEGDVGYTTMDGDTSGGLAPISGVDKHFVRQWLIWLRRLCITTNCNM